MNIEEIIAGKDFPIYKFCKEKDIECAWDFSKSDNASWTEIYIDNKLVMQFQNTTTVKQFIEVIQRLKKDFNDKCLDIDGDDFWFVVEKKKYFVEFINEHYQLFEKKMNTNTELAKRCDELFTIGMKFNLKENAYIGKEKDNSDFYVPVLDIQCKDQKDWNLIIEMLKNELKNRRNGK
jgi:hypothetical protein